MKNKTMNAMNLTLILTFCIIASLSQATHPLAIKSSKLNQTQQQLDESCSYIVTIKTSCSSTFFARGEIDLIFGDAYGNQVFFVPQLPGGFEDCSTYKYDVIHHGACPHQICHLHLLWLGDSECILETVSIYNHLDGPVTFHYNTFIPSGVPYGFDDCHDY